VAHGEFLQTTRIYKRQILVLDIENPARPFSDTQIVDSDGSRQYLSFAQDWVDAHTS
jgi:hypothetical protein